jgi:hypothetical protein
VSRNTIKALDLYCQVLNWNESLKNAHDDERPRWTVQRDHVLTKFRAAMTKITQEEFLKGRGARLETWNKMKDTSEC